MTIANKWVSDLEVDAIKHLLERPVSIQGLTALEMWALATLSKKGFVSCRDGVYRANLRLITALTERAIRKGVIKVDRKSGLAA